ncbi:MAG: Uma2 family endonuclease [Blastocatellia bacterium]|nr:Uma2 family endonuclease [Blastocatellia bacterium]
MSLRKKDALTSIYYPESDGEPLAETDIHAQLIIDLRFALKSHFRDEPDVYVSSNLLLYYVEGDPKKRVAPDVFLVRGVEKKPRRIYKLWEEGRAPDMVVEVSSRETWRDDLHRKWQLYQRIAVKEYFIFDPEYDYLPEPVIAYKLEEGAYEALEVKEGRVKSEVLGLEIVDTGETLRLYDPRSGQFLMTEMEAEGARRRAQEELIRLRHELDRLRHPEATDAENR